MQEVEFDTRKYAHLKVAVVHDWIFHRRGGERVLENILNLFPQADLYCLFAKSKDVLVLKHKHKMIQSYLSVIPLIESFYKYLLPLLPMAIESFNLTNYDLVISSSSCVAKGIIISPLGRHISYTHSPMRYAWDQEHRYFKRQPSFFRPLELVRRFFLNRLRIWDVTASIRIDKLIANSDFVARRCSLYYGRKAQVIYPPVDVFYFSTFINTQPKFNYSRKILLFGAWVPYKQMYSALKFLLEHKIPVIAAGHGEEFKKARKEFNKLVELVEFVENPSDKEVPLLYQRSHALLFPSIEDFGIVPLEATASGIWVISPNTGGTAETVINEETGFTFLEGNSISMLSAIKKALNTEITNACRQKMQSHVQRFSSSRFKSEFLNHIDELLHI